MAVMIALMALSLFSLIGLYMAFNATTELRISDNYESQAQALAAAKAGLSHARQLLVGRQYNDLLQGPDGTYTNTSAYLTQGRTFSFRNPFGLDVARSLDILNPSASLGGIADDGIINTGKVAGVNGTPLIPQAGIAFTATNPYGSGTITTARYFVKVTDNNTEVSELAGDPLDNPFVDGDGIIIIRSMGIAQTIRETGGGAVRANSVAVVEAKFKNSRTFALDSPVVVEGTSVAPAGSNMYSGNAFQVDGQSSNVGISTIDANLLDIQSPYADMYGGLSKSQTNNVKGLGGSPSMADITGVVMADTDKSKLVDSNYLYDFATNVVPTFADHVYTGPLKITSSNAADYDLGYYDYTKPYNDPTQRLVATIVKGDLEVGSSGVSGGGLLVVTGKLSGNGSLTYQGLILVIGTGSTDLAGVNVSIHGGIYTVNVTLNALGQPVFGQSKFSLGGNSDIIFDSSAINMGVSLIPSRQIGVREIRSSMDP